MIRILCLFVLASLLAGCAVSPRSPGAGAPYHDRLVVPNKRIGAAVIGMSREQMIAWLGHPDEAVGSGDGAYRYDGDGLQVAFDGERAYVISVTKPGYTTADGMAVGAPEQELSRRWGAPTASRESTRCVDRRCASVVADALHQCFANGMQADIDLATHAVTELQVRAGGCHSP